MAQDYNIYLHAPVSTDEARERTTPLVNRVVEDTNIDGSSASSSILDSFTKVQNSISSFTSQGFTGLLSTGMSMLTKLVPWLAFAFATIKVADSVIDYTTSLMSEYTGHFQFAMQYNNFKAGVNNVINPASYIKKQVELQFAINKQNIQIEQNRTLVGSSTLRSNRIGI